MRIVRCSQQGPQTLREFYRDWATGREWRFYNPGELMLELLDRLEDFPGPSFWGSTSHHQLRLHSQDSTEAPILCIVHAMQEGAIVMHEGLMMREPYFSVACSALADEAMWPDSHLTGGATCVEDAAFLVRTIVDRYDEENARLAARETWEPFAQRLKTTPTKLFVRMREVCRSSPGVTMASILAFLDRLLEADLEPVTAGEEIGLEPRVVESACRALEQLRESEGPLD